jgi:hypothetical protein
MRKPRKKAPPKRRNLAAKSLASGLFRPRVEAHPKAYKRRAKHRLDPARSLPADGGDDKA